MIAVSDRDLVIYFQHLGYKIIDYISLGIYMGNEKFAYVFNERNRLSPLKELYERGGLEIKRRELYYKKTAGQDEELALLPE